MKKAWTCNTTFTIKKKNNKQFICSFLFVYVDI